MPRQSTSRASLQLVLLLCGMAVTTGCATWQVPRIDPSGERFFIWPNQSPAFAAPPAAVVAPPPAFVGPPVGAPPTAPPPGATYAPPGATYAPPTAPFGNVQAPPVYSDPAPPTGPPASGGFVSPFAPAPTAPPVITAPAPPINTVPPPPVFTAPPTTAVPAPAPLLPITPVVPAGPPNAAAAVVVGAPPGSGYLRVLPAGVLAPVGSEVVLQAGICGASGNLLTNQRVDWTIDRAGVGQFGDLGGREPLYSFSRWNAARLVDPWTAVSSTAAVPLRLTRGTSHPHDDVQIPRGDAWVTVTSAVEGTSRITAYTPSVGSWNRAVATIYWVDAQWLFPPSAVVEPGRPHVLTTTVMRRTDGAPIAGWLVRYDVAGGASLGYEGGNSTEVPTDANGQASVEVSPVSPGGGATTVGVTIIRPAVEGPQASPRFKVGRASATVTWGANAAPAQPAPFTPIPSGPPPPSSPYTPGPVIGPPPSTTPIEPRPALPSGPTSPDPYTPPADEFSAGPPRLELNLRRTGPEQIGVGEYAGFEVTITNRGNGAARGIRVRDRFDTGLRHPAAQPNEFAVEYPNVRDLPPGESTTIPLTFQVVAGGTHCHEVTVTAEGAQPVSERACITARQAALEVTVTAPRTRVVGEVAQFNVVVKNTGEVPATNVEIVNRYDAALEPDHAPEGHERLPDGGILLRIDRLLAGERRTLSTTAICRTPSNQACNRAIVTADGGVTAAAEGCVEILPTLSTGPGGRQ